MYSKEQLKQKSIPYLQIYDKFKIASDISKVKSLLNFNDNDVTLMSATKSKLLLSDLKPVTIITMKARKNKGSRIRLTSVYPCYRQNSIYVLGEDETKQNIIFLEINNFYLKGLGLDHYFSIGSSFFVKEPFYLKRIHQLSMIQINNCQDIVFDDNPEAEQFIDKPNQIVKSEPAVIQVNEELQEMRLKGQSLTKSKQYLQAYLLYDQIIKISRSKSESSKFLVNKAIICSYLNLKKQYIENIKAAIALDIKNAKAHYHLIKALALLNKFQQARIQLKKCDLFGKAEKDILANYIQLHENTSKGLFNWPEMGKYSEDFGQYMHPGIKIQKSQYGSGIIATDSIRSGEILLIEKPIIELNFLTNEQIQQCKKQNGHMKVIFNRIINMTFELYNKSPQFRQKINHLVSIDAVKQSGLVFNREEYNNNHPNIKQNIENIIKSNAFSIHIKNCPPELQLSGLYLFDICSIFNHQCQCNCKKINEDGFIVVYACKDIKKGDQIFIQYVFERDHKKRTKQLKAWDIKCNCIFCYQQQFYQKNPGNPRKVKSSELQKLMIENALITNNQTIDRNILLNHLYHFNDCRCAAAVLKFGEDRKRYEEMIRRIFGPSWKEGFPRFVTG